MKALRALATALFILSCTFSCASEPAYATTTRNDYTFNLGTVRQVVCGSPKGVAKDTPVESLTPEQLDAVDNHEGTGTIIAQNRVLTAQHVVAGDSYCIIGHKHAVVTYQDKPLDIAILSVPLGNTAVAPISCDGFSAKHAYFALGYAWGQDFALQLELFTGEYITDFVHEPGEEGADLKQHMAKFAGAVFGGMSGGPIFGIDGRVVGVISIGDEDGDWSGARDLAETPLCTILKAAA